MALVGECTIGTNTVLGSQWGKLSNHLIASIYEVDRKGNRIVANRQDIML